VAKKVKTKEQIPQKEKTSSFTSHKKEKQPQTMEELLAIVGSQKIGLKKGETVEGEVVSLSPKEILIDIGKKSFGIVAEWELEQVKEYAASLKVGDKVLAQVVNPENDLGYVVLSLRRANIERRWLKLTQAKEEGLDLEVTVLEGAKGGLLVDWEGLRGFVPFTQLEGEFAANPLGLINKRIKVKVLEVERSLNRLVVSQKAASLGVTPSKQREMLEKIKANDVLKGVVSGVAPFGIFVDVNGLEGLVHISEIAWTKVENPASLFKVGDKVEVLVLDVDKKEGKLNLSVKRLTPDPWKNILDRYPVDAQVRGKIVRVAPFGVFVNLEPGIEGLIHISKIPPEITPKVGEEITCVVEKIDPLKRKMSLTIIPKEKPVGYR